MYEPNQNLILSDVCEISTGFAFRKSIPIDHHQPNSYVLQVKNLSTFATERFESLPPIFMEKIPKQKTLTENCLLLAAKGDDHKVYAYDHKEKSGVDMPLVFTNHIFKISSHNDYIDLNYIEWYLNNHAHHYFIQHSQSSKIATKPNKLL